MGHLKADMNESLLFFLDRYRFLRLNHDAVVAFVVLLWADVTVDTR